MNIIKKIYFNKYFGKVFHTSVNCLQKELSDCQTVLDLGCGPNSPLQFCGNIKKSIGVEAFSPYLEESKRKNIHTKYIKQKIEKVNFKENSFDAVILIEVLEHLPEKNGLEIIKKAQKWAKKKIIISSPNGYLPQKEVDNNLLQKHLSGWDFKKMYNLGFKSRGLAGLKILRREVQNTTMGDDLTTSIKFSPKIFWFVIATFSQIATYHIPRLSFELFSVKLIDKN